MLTFTDSPLTAIQQRRDKIKSYDLELDKFEDSVVKAEERVAQVKKLVWKEADNVTPSQCGELTAECQVHADNIFI